MKAFSEAEPHAITFSSPLTTSSLYGDMHETLLHTSQAILGSGSCPYITRGSKAPLALVPSCCHANYGPTAIMDSCRSRRAGEWYSWSATKSKH